MPLLRSLGNNSNRLHGLTERLVQIEGHADDIHDAGLKALYQRCAGEHPMEFVVRREILNHLEKVVDGFEDVANEIQGLVIDHAYTHAIFSPALGPHCRSVAVRFSEWPARCRPFPIGSATCRESVCQSV